jgi:tetratricopeptide (TPR) repeat protein
MPATLADRFAGAIALGILAALTACAPVPPAPPQPIVPQITEETLRIRARDQFASGIKLYDAGDFDGAQKILQESLDHGLLSRSDQGVARKYLAFVHCIGGRESACRAEFRKAFEIDPTFALTPAEDGHPIWGPVYRSVRAQLIAESESARKPAATIAKAEQLLADGIARYDAGDFPEALRLLEAASTEGLKEKADQVLAMKHSAFCLCLMQRYPACRAQFLKIFEIDPAFDLTPAEAGHPSWTRTFAGAKAQFRRTLPGASTGTKPKSAP